LRACVTFQNNPTTIGYFILPRAKVYGFELAIPFICRVGAPGKLEPAYKPKRSLQNSSAPFCGCREECNTAIIANKAKLPSLAVCAKANDVFDNINVVIVSFARDIKPAFAVTIP